MDRKERSPSFLEVKLTKSNSEKKSLSKTQKFMFKPMPSLQLLQSLNMCSPLEQVSTAKKLSMKPVRTADLNLDEFKESPKISTRNVRKQLWSVEKRDNKWTVDKGDKLRRVTVMKPARDNLKKSVYSRPTLLQPKKSISNYETKSINDTLPLMDMEQFTVTKIKRTLFSAPQPKSSIQQRKTTSHINVNKMPIVSSFAKKIAKPPSIIITPAEKSVKKSININKTISNNKSKITNEIKEDRVDLLFDKLSILEEKMNSLNQLDEIKEVLCMISAHMGINLPSNFFPKNKVQIQKSEPILSSTINSKTELSSPYFKRDLSSTPLPTIKENINSAEFKEKVYKLSPFIIKSISNVTNEENYTSNVTTNNHVEIVENDTLSMKLKLSPCILKETNNQVQNDTYTESDSLKLLNHLEKNDTFTPSTSKEPNIQLQKDTESESICALKEITNNPIEKIDDTFTESKSNENCEKVINSDVVEKNCNSVETPLNLKITRPCTPNNETVQNSIKLQDIFTPKTDQTQKINNNKIESTIKLKKTWITQFEQIENKLLNNSNVSINLNSSTDDSPIIHELQIDQIVNDDDDVDTANKLKLKKSLSTSNLPEGNDGSLRKNIVFKSKENLLTESICVYNELRDVLPKFLSTPVNNTNKTMSFMTPSVQGNAKKMISRRVQEQLLRLNDC